MSSSWSKTTTKITWQRPQQQPQLHLHQYLFAFVVCALHPRGPVQGLRYPFQCLQNVSNVQWPQPHSQEVPSGCLIQSAEAKLLELPARNLEIGSVHFQVRSTSGGCVRSCAGSFSSRVDDARFFIWKRQCDHRKIEEIELKCWPYFHLHSLHAEDSIISIVHDVTIHMRSHPHALLKTVTPSPSPDCSRCSLHCIKLVSSKPSSVWTQCLYEVSTARDASRDDSACHIDRRRA